ncbi:hypothetical protein IMZ48_06670 [Candidatus Bathyarchaeota archaeon]|nr:hypothetical protein [Candidatus Bathyarchaeota archaeon]
MRSSGSPYLSEEAHVASLQGVALDREGAAAPTDEPCKDSAETPATRTPAANGGCPCPGGGKTSNTPRKNEPLHSATAALPADLCGLREDHLPPFEGTLRRKKKVEGLRETAL